MGLTGFRAGNHPQQTGKRGPKDAIDDRGTDPALFAELDARFQFTLDVAASAANAKCERYYSIEDDGLEQSWAAERVWCNPPYSDLRAWVHKAWDEWNAWRPNMRERQWQHVGPELIVMLVPASRCEQAWWQDYVEPFRDGRRLTEPALRTEFLRGRRRFVRPGAEAIGPNERPPFGSCLLIWERENKRGQTPERGGPNIGPEVGRDV